MTQYIFFSVVFFLQIQAVPAATVYSQPADSGVAQGNDFWKVTVDGASVPVYQAVVHDDGPTYFCSFDFTGTVTVCAEPTSELSGPILRPLSTGVAVQTNADHTIQFDIAQPGQYCLEARSYSYAQPLCIFANPPEENIPEADDPSVLYYGPGYHDVTTISMGNKTTLYLAGGSYLKVRVPENEVPVLESDTFGMPKWASMLYRNGRTNVSVRGRGIIDLSAVPWHGRQPFVFQSCTNVTVEGITVIDSPSWTMSFGNCEDVFINNVKLIGHRQNSDGIDIVSSRNVAVSNCFVRTGDDGICVKSIGYAASGIQVENCVLWNDRVRAIGVCGESACAIQDVTFRDIDILHSLSSFSGSYCMAVYINQQGPVENVLFENIRVEAASKLIRVGIKNTALSTASSSSISNVIFRNIQYSGKTMPSSEVRGAGSNYRVKNVLFDNVTFDGKKATSASSANLTVGDYVNGVSFQ
ncbi:MAG: glycosyl hydrolase family 28 protein [Kiritimatiellales bacterium]